MKTLIWIIVLVLIVGGAYWFFMKKASVPAPVTQTQTQTQTSAATPAAAAVAIKNFAFTPATISVSLGSTVIWTNNDTVAHTVTSDSGNTLNSRTIAPGQSFSFTFTSPGTYAYHCTIHPMMKGTVTVNP